MEPWFGMLGILQAEHRVNGRLDELIIPNREGDLMGEHASFALATMSNRLTNRLERCRSANVVYVKGFLFKVGEM